jgi:predicted metal-dependent peptidase
VLHAGLNHAGRRAGRDPMLWNVACDFVINDWLVGLNLGQPPRDGLLYDEELRGLPAEEIYLRLAADLRVRRRLATLRGDDVDLLDERAERGFTDREEFCRCALLQGLDYHQASGRGLLPAALVQAIRTLNQPAIPWRALLAEWIQERCPLPERKRSWARPSRRQSATPDIPRPRFVEPEDERATRTFGVIVDTSGSMQRDDLGKALGAIVAYSRAQAVRQVRLVYSDAAPCDEGYVDIESLAGRVKVRGRGGTVLQAAVNLLQGRTDFPKTSPILIVTDGMCESDLAVARDHAFLLSPGMRLPFVTGRPVFEMA